MKKIACLVGMLLASAAAGNANAAVYSWTITGPTGFSGSGQFTTQDTPTAPPEDLYTPNVGPGYLLTSFTGTFAGLVVQLKSWDPEQGPYYSDNLFYPTGHYPFIDDDGLLFQTLKANGSVSKVYSLFDSHTCGGNTGGCWEQAKIGYPNIPGGSKNVTFAFTTITPVPPAAVPEPATWAMMIGGFGMVGAGMRRRRAIVRTA